MSVRHFAVLPALLVVLLVCTDARATFHLWQVNELYSTADGQTQFIELFTLAPGQEFLATPTAAQLISEDAGSSAENTYTFTSNSPSPTNNHHLLIATADVGSLPGGVTPDYIIPSNFLFTGGGTLTLTDIPNGGFETAFVFNYGALPGDGSSSLMANGSTATNSPTNFAGDSGSLIVPEPASLALLGLGAVALVRRRRK